jgi:hypothetical protein
MITAGKPKFYISYFCLTCLKPNFEKLKYKNKIAKYEIEKL